ncbi:MAG TPA: hypothetical protein VI819_05205 [Patescibacteria group bacterium]|nr:hypothetical protein [Patescibacteria group bacterium]
MNNKVIVAAVVLILLLVGGGAYLMMSKKSGVTTPTSVNNSQGSAVQETTGSGQKSLKDLLLAGVPQKCSFSDVSSGVEMDGTSYIAGGKVRADFNSKTEGKATSGHTIVDGNTSYIWMDGSQTGFKMEVNETESDTSSNTNQEGLDLNKSIDYKCSTWLPDQSLFNPPSDVSFTQFSAPPTQAAGSNTQLNNLCSSCDALTGDQKTQCLSALNCN